jgi:aryl-alcohol dehydrogenase-like predicted oxidoreductase
MKLNEYVTLGRSGLRVSPLTLGTMTFGTEWGTGADEKGSRAIFDAYLDRGGNTIDTADGYTKGTSETMLGKFITDAKNRDKLVLNTKFTFNGTQGNPNTGGNGRKNIYRALESSLKRLQTDFIDLYWLHAWDTVTPVEEVVSTLADLVAEGKIRYYGFSDTPAWYAARAYTLAEQHGRARLTALQLEYSLLERNIEREHLPAAQELGLGVCPWSPLGGGMLTGKYQRHADAGKGTGEGRLASQATRNPNFSKFSERNFKIVDALNEAAKALGKPAAQVALNWCATQPGITSTIIGATKTSQLADNLASLDVTIPAELRKKLDEASAIEVTHPYSFFGGDINAMITGGTTIHPWTAAHLTGGPAPKPPAESKPAEAKPAAAGSEKK